MKITIEKGIDVSNKEKERIEAFKELLLSFLQPHNLSMERTRIPEIIISEDEVAFRVKCVFDKVNAYARLGWIFRVTCLKDKIMPRHNDFTDDGFIMFISRQSLME